MDIAGFLDAQQEKTGYLSWISCKNFISLGVALYASYENHINVFAWRSCVSV